MTKIFAGIGLLSLLAACGGDELVLPSEGSPAAIVVIDGNEQTGRVGTTLPAPLVVAVTDSRGRPVEGVSVTFTFDGGTGSAAIPATVTTDIDGRASVELQLGTAVGGLQGVARVAGVDGSAPQVDFAAVAVPALASEIRLVSGDGQSGQVGSTLGQRLMVEVIDAFGNPNQGASITWTVTGGGTVSSATTTTGANGRTSVERTLGSTAGEQTARASAPGLVGSPVIFTHTATAANASRVTVVSGSNQTAVVATRLPQDVVAQVLDANDNPVPGVTVSWVVTSGGGSVESSTSTTGANGRASNRWTLGLLPGANQLEARVTGAGKAEFTATATIGPSASLVVNTQPSGTAVVNVVFGQQPVIQLRDALGNNVSQAGVPITAAIASGDEDGSLLGTTTRTTSSNGRATFTNLRIAGATGPYTLIFSTAGHTSISSNVIEVGKAPTTVNLNSAAPSPSVAGQSVVVGWLVTSTAGSPTGTVTITASGGSETCSASVAAGSCSLTLNVVGSRVLTATYGGDALFSASSDTRSHTVEAANGAPVAVIDQYTAVEDVPLTGSVSVLANDTDPDDDLLSAERITDAQHGSVTLNPNGTFTYTPDDDFHGTDSFTYRANDGDANSNVATVTITVNAVNDAPSFTSGGAVSRSTADVGEQSVGGWATSISAGPANESGQGLEFEVTANDAPGLFTIQPSVSADGTLTFTLAGTEGVATVTIRLTDSGGIANGGVNASATQTFTITVTAPPLSES